MPRIVCPTIGIILVLTGASISGLLRPVVLGAFGLGHALVGLAIMILGAILLAPTVSGWMATVATRLLLGGFPKLREPPLDLEDTVDRLLQQGRSADAERIACHTIRGWPRHPMGYCLLIRCRPAEEAPRIVVKAATGGVVAHLRSVRNEARLRAGEVAGATSKPIAPGTSAPTPGPRPVRGIVLKHYPEEPPPPKP